MNFKLYRSLAGLDELEAQWLALVENASGAQFYQLPQWYRAYLHALIKPDRSLFFVAAFEGETLHFVLPLVQRSIKAYGFDFKVLKSPSHDHMSLVGGLCSNDYLLHNNIHSLYQFLRQQNEIQWDWIYFKKLVENTDVHRLVENSRFRNVYEKSYVKSYYIDCGHGLDQSLQSLSSKFKRNLRRQQRKAQQLGELKFEILEGESLVQYFDDFLALESSGWKGKSNTSIISHPNLVLFYRLLVEYQHKYNRCILNALFLNGELIAAQLGILNGSTMNLLKIAYSEKMSSIAPGNILLNNVIKYCTEQSKIQELCFVTGPKWAQAWKTGERGVYSYLLFNKTIKGRVSYIYTWVKHLLISTKKIINKEKVQQS